MNLPTDLSAEVKHLLEESVKWRLFGLLFEYPSPEWRSNLTALLTSLARPELRNMAEAALAQATEGLHFALFGPAGTVPVREVTYRGGVQFGYLMAELSAYYEAFGYEPKIDEAADHLSIQLGFKAFLKLKQALALMEGDADRAALTKSAAQDFLREHIAVQAEPVLRRLHDFAPEYLADAMRLIMQHSGPSPRSDYPLSSALIDDACDEMSCGRSASGDDLVSIYEGVPEG